jgi:hypothetical protein
LPPFAAEFPPFFVLSAAAFLRFPAIVLSVKMPNIHRAHCHAPLHCRRYGVQIGEQMVAFLDFISMNFDIRHQSSKTGMVRHAPTVTEFDCQRSLAADFLL